MVTFRRVWLILLTAGWAWLVLVWAGYFDPKPIGQPVASLYGVSIPEISHSQYKALIFIPTKNNFSALITTEFTPPGGGFNLIIGIKKGIEIALWSNGFAGIQQGPGRVIVPLTTFPHIEGTKNEVWIDVERQHLVRVRFNKEIFWEGDIVLDEPAIAIESLGGSQLRLSQAVLFE